MHVDAHGVLCTLMRMECVVHVDAHGVLCTLMCMECVVLWVAAM